MSPTASRRGAPPRAPSPQARRCPRHLLGPVRTGAIDPTTVITRVEDQPSVLQAHETFDQRQSGRTKAVTHLTRPVHPHPTHPEGDP